VTSALDHERTARQASLRRKARQAALWRVIFALFTMLFVAPGTSELTAEVMAAVTGAECCDEACESGGDCCPPSCAHCRCCAHPLAVVPGFVVVALETAAAGHRTSFPRGAAQAYVGDYRSFPFRPPTA
jgi:hypothetical protein